MLNVGFQQTTNPGDRVEKQGNSIVKLLNKVLPLELPTESASLCSLMSSRRIPPSGMFLLANIHCNLEV